MTLSDKTNFAVMFPGQGSQYIGMGENLYNKSLVAKKIFDLADEILNFSISSLCFKGNIKELIKTNNAQTAIFLVSYISYRMYIFENDLKPAVLLGHSLGEVTALACSGAIDFKDALEIVKFRGKYMLECGEKANGSMMAIMSKDTDAIEKLCNEVSDEIGTAVISNYNSGRQTVVSGRLNALNALKEKLKKEHMVSTMLNVSAPFHCSLMKSVAERLKLKLNNYQYNDISIPTVSNVTGALYASKNDIQKNLTLQITRPVQWIKSVETACNLGVDFFVETGPKYILKSLNKDIRKNIKSISLDLEEDRGEFSRMLANLKNK